MISLESFPFHPSFDKEYMEELFGDETSYFLEIVEFFFKAFPSEMNELKNAYTSGDSPEIAKKLHKLSSMLGCVGQTELSTQCKLVEKSFNDTAVFIIAPELMIEKLDETALLIQNTYDELKKLSEETL